MEPYFGGGAVFFKKPWEWIEGHSEVINDLNGGLVNFYRVLARDETFQELKRLVEMTPFAEEEFELCRTEIEGIRELGVKSRVSVPFAHAFFVQYRQSRQGLGEDFATLSRNRTRRGMSEQTSAWLSAIDGLPDAHDRFKRVVILCQDAINVIRSQDGPNTFFYLDPPYVHSTRTARDAYGEFEMSERAHVILLATLGKIDRCLYSRQTFEELSGKEDFGSYLDAVDFPFRGKFLLSGYPAKIYHDYADMEGWSLEAFDIDNKSSGAKKKSTKTECLWRNF